MSAPVALPSLHGVVEVQALLAARLRAVRLRLGWKQSTLAARSGVSLPTVRRYEQDGQITLGNWLRLCQALGVLDELAGRFEPPPVLTLQDLERVSAPLPQRGRR